MRAATGGTRGVAPRRVTARMPTPRALTGGLLVTLSALGVFVAHRAAAEAPTDRYVVAVRNVEAGRAVSANDLGTVAMDLPDGVSGIPAADADRVVGRVARTPLSELDLVRPGDLFEPGRFDAVAAVEVAVDLEPARALAGTIRPGDSVDVLSTDPDGEGTRTIVRRARVTAIGDPGRDGIGSSGRQIVRLGVADSTTAERVVDAAVRRVVTLALPAPATGGGT